MSERERIEPSHCNHENGVCVSQDFAQLQAERDQLRRELEESHAAYALAQSDVDKLKASNVDWIKRGNDAIEQAEQQQAALQESQQRVKELEESRPSKLFDELRLSKQLHLEARLALEERQRRVDDLAADCLAQQTIIQELAEALRLATNHVPMFAAETRRLGKAALASASPWLRKDEK